MNNIPEKYVNNCPLDHSSFYEFISCDCNYGGKIEIWNFKQQEINKLKSEIEKLKKENLELKKIERIYLRRLRTE